MIVIIKKAILHVIRCHL